MQLTAPDAAIAPERKEPAAQNLAALCIGALGVVYGDIGTSPLYALRQCFQDGAGIAPTMPNVPGILSLIFWALMIVISIKYLAIVVHAGTARTRATKRHHRAGGLAEFRLGKYEEGLPHRAGTLRRGPALW